MLTVNKSGIGSGTVTSTSNPPSATQINCGAACYATYDWSTVARSRATALMRAILPDPHLPRSSHPHILISSDSCCHQRADRLADDGALDVARRAEIEHDDRQAIGHAERNRRRVHHLESLLEHLEVDDRKH